MSNNNSGPKNSKIFPLFITFAILFVVVFGLGVIIGKGLGGSDTNTVVTTPLNNIFIFMIYPNWLGSCINCKNIVGSLCLINVFALVPDIPAQYGIFYWSINGLLHDKYVPLNWEKSVLYCCVVFGFTFILKLDNSI